MVQNHCFLLRRERICWRKNYLMISVINLVAELYKFYRVINILLSLYAIKLAVLSSNVYFFVARLSISIFSLCN